MLKTHTGSCYCGAVQFEAAIDLQRGTTKCNCSYCAKVRLWSVQASDADFRVLTGQDRLTDYRGDNPVAHHHFCSVCGVHVYDRIETPNMTGRVYLNLNIATLKNVDIPALLATGTTYCDGLHNNWGAAPTETRHL